MKRKKSKILKNRLDEMQEQKMLKIEHNGCWLAFWGLAIALVVQRFIYGQGDWQYTAGEWIVFMCLAWYMVIDCIRNGIWDRRLSPTPTVNIIASVAAGAACGIFFFISSYRQYHKLLGSIATGAAMLIFVFVVCFFALSLFSALYKYRNSKMENEEDRDSDGDEDKYI